MKKTRRIAAMVAAMALAATMAVPMSASLTASAANPTASVVVDGNTENALTGVTPTKDNTDHTYTAYEIFKGKYDATLGLTITAWGDDIDSSALVADDAFKALVIDTTTNKTVNDFISGKTVTPALIAQALEGINSETAQARELAQILEKHLVKTSGHGDELSQDSTNPTELAQGYYLVLDEYFKHDNTTGADATNDALSRYILQVAGTDAITIVPKKTYPTVTKKVKDNDDTFDGYAWATGQTDAMYSDVADYCIGDAVPFRLYGTLPGTLDDYTKGYKYVFNDKCDNSLDINADSVVVDIYTADGTKKASTAPTTEETTNGVQTITTGTGNTCVITPTAHALTVSFDNVKAAVTDNAETTEVVEKLEATDRVVVSYTATLNANAEIGLNGQQNKVYISYSNNPEWDGTGAPTTDDTNTDYAIVFTYELDNTKIDAQTKEALPDAKFVLSRTVSGAKQYAVVDNGKIAGWVSGITPSVNAAKEISWTGTATAVVGTATTPSVITSDSDGKFNVAGLDEGTYVLTELVAPEGYNKLEGDITVEIAANTLDDNGTKTVALTQEELDARESGDESTTKEVSVTADRQNWSGDPTDALIELTLSVTNTDGKASTTGTGDIEEGIVAETITNAKGTKLPSTGGMGTNLFVLGGGVTMAAAGIYLVSKKRAKDAE